VKEVLARDFGIGHVTLELEPVGGECTGSSCDLAPPNLGANHRHFGQRH